MLAATRAIRETLAKIHADGSPISLMEDRLVPFEEFTDLIGLPEIEDLEERFEDKEVRAPR
jgi:2,3-dimethylmalate lyase